jgi:hypothetical protein
MQQRHRPSLSRLRGTETSVCEAPADHRRSPLSVEIVPLQAADLAGPHSGLCPQAKEDPEVEIQTLSGAEDGPELARREGIGTGLVLALETSQANNRVRSQVSGLDGRAAGSGEG